MTIFSWTGTASSAFANAANWIDNGTGLPGAVPGAGDTAELAGTGAITGAGAVSALDITAARSLGWTLDGQFASRVVSDLGTLTLSDTLAPGAPSQLLATAVTVAGEDSSLTLEGATLGALHGHLDVLVSTANPNGLADAQLVVGSSTGAKAGFVDLGTGTATIGAGDGQVGALVLNDGAIAGDAGSAIVIGKDGGSGGLYDTSNQTTLSAGRLVVGDSGTGLAVLHYPVTLDLGDGGGPALVIGTTDYASGEKPGSGALNASGGQLSAQGAVDVGETGQGSLSLTDTMFDTEHGLVIGAVAGAQGAVALTEDAWKDTGDVVVGEHGAGSLLVSADPGSVGPYGASSIDGDVQIGVAGGSGSVTLQGSTLTVSGRTVLGAGHQDTIILQDAAWNSAGQDVRLVGSTVAGPFQPGGDSVTLSADSSLIAGFLSVGTQDFVIASQSGTITLGSSAAGAAGAIAGSLLLGQGSTLSARGNLRVDRSLSASRQNGLTLYGGTATLLASQGYALTLANGGLADLQGSGSRLTAQGGILASDGALEIQGGTVLASSGRLALDIAAGGRVDVQAGTLETSGLFSIGDSDRRLATFAPGGSLTAGSGAVLDSMAASPGGVAVAICGGSADIAQATWSVTGRFLVGATGHGALSANGAVVEISGALQIGGARSAGNVSTGDTDTVVSGGTLSAGQTGISASSIMVDGGGSSLHTGALEIGTALSRGDLCIDGGAVVAVAGASLNGVLRLGHGGLLAAATIDLAPHAAILGSGTLQAGDIAVQGDVFVSRGSLAFIGPVSGAGVLHLSDGTLDLAQGEAAGVGIAFGAAGTLVTPSVAGVAGELSGWQGGDAILFSGQAIASDSFSHGTLSLFDGAHALLGTEVFSGAVSAADFVLTAEQGGGTLLSFHQ